MDLYACAETDVELLETSFRSLTQHCACKIRRIAFGRNLLNTAEPVSSYAKCRGHEITNVSLFLYRRDCHRGTGKFAPDFCRSSGCRPFGVGPLRLCEEKVEISRAEEVDSWNELGVIRAVPRKRRAGSKLRVAIGQREL